MRASTTDLQLHVAYIHVAGQQSTFLSREFLTVSCENEMP